MMNEPMMGGDLIDRAMERLGAVHPGELAAVARSLHATSRPPVTTPIFRALQGALVELSQERPVPTGSALMAMTELLGVLLAEIPAERRAMTAQFIATAALTAGDLAAGLDMAERMPGYRKPGPFGL